MQSHLLAKVLLLELIRFGQNQNLVTQKTSDLLRIRELALVKKCKEI